MDETPKKTFNPIILIVVIVLLLVGGFFLFNSMKSQPANQQAATTAVETPVPTQAVATETGTMTDQSVKPFTVEGGSFYFKPNEIKVKKGDKVKITFTNAGGLHDFVLDEFNVRTDKLESGDSTTIEFTADKVGTFEYYCSIANHRQMGMKGNLIVTE